MTKPDQKPEEETREPGGRNTRKPDEMDSDSLAAAYGDAARLRAHEIAYEPDLWIGKWMGDVRAVLGKRGHLELIREFLPFYFDPSRKQAVFGPGGKLINRLAIERVIQPTNPRAITS